MDTFDGIGFAAPTCGDDVYSNPPECEMLFTAIPTRSGVKWVVTSQTNKDAVYSILDTVTAKATCDSNPDNKNQREE